MSGILDDIVSTCFNMLQESCAKDQQRKGTGLAVTFASLTRGIEVVLTDHRFAKNSRCHFYMASMLDEQICVFKMS